MVVAWPAAVEQIKVVEGELRLRAGCRAHGRLVSKLALCAAARRRSVSVHDPVY